MHKRMKLTNLSLLEVLNSQEYSHWLKIFRSQNFKKKDIIYHPNHEENLVFVVKKGRVRVYLAYSEKEFTLSILEAGAVYSTHTRAYIQALEDCELMIADIQSFGRVMTEHPTFMLTVIQVLGDLLKNSISIINGLVFKEVNQRLIEFIIRAAEEKGMAREEGIIVELNLSSEEIAMMLGTTRQTISLLLNDFYKSGILSKLGRRTILIKDIGELKGMILSS
ncbi:global nitrogen regulator [Oxobacter pfennigii]|uniref:Global nitrogen regulator n=1 Tax=Oxobacter pfennigii TaxID=36849 RepID=A0A0P8W6D4_9CLOT|nr:Crp/Fnr family transcriptional regulator [Oxobacter pfennigii]KPU44253.1 global nitrogen regulator [Oxobacter pfennigii]